MGLFGEALKTDICKASEAVPMLIEGLIPKQSTTQFFAADGIGKSILILNAMAQASSGSPVFGDLELEKPIKCMFFMAERPKIEAYQRLKVMMQKIDINWDNFYLETDLQGFDLIDQNQRVSLTTQIIQRAKEFGNPDWIHIDPIYAWVSGELTGEKGASAINYLLRRTQKETEAAISYNHHSNRGVRNRETNKRESEDMYGGRFLSANCTGIFHIKGRDDKKGSIFEQVKDSYSCLHKKIKLTYDPQFCVSYANDSEAKMQKKDKIKYFLKHYLSIDKEFSFDTFCEENQLSTAYGRIQLSRHLENGNIIIVNSKSRKNLHKVVRVMEGSV